MNIYQKNMRGGKRLGAGRPKGSNKHGESTHPIRIPVSKIDEVKAFIEGSIMPVRCPLFSSKVQAGFPSPADEHIATYLDLNTHLIKHPAATFFVIATGDSMQNAGIQSGDLLIVDRAIKATHHKIIVAALNGELTVKRLHIEHHQIRLLPAHPDYPIIDITESQDFLIWGVVTHVIHSTRS